MKTVKVYSKFANIILEGFVNCPYCKEKLYTETADGVKASDYTIGDKLGTQIEEVECDFCKEKFKAEF